MIQVELPSARAFLRKWVREEVMALDEVSVSEMTAEAMNYLRDHGLLESFTKEIVKTMVANETRSTFSTMRRGAHQVGDLILTNKVMDQRVRRLVAGVWPTWMRAPEWIGDRHLVPTKMKHADLLAAAEIRDKRGSHEMKVAELWRTLADGLEGQPTLTVQDVYSPQEIEAIRNQIMGGED